MCRPHEICPDPSPNSIPHASPNTALQEDINEEPRPRMWWPREIWGIYATNLEDLKGPAHSAAAVRCLNHMVRSGWRR